jgi:hypothetical protein
MAACREDGGDEIAGAGPALERGFHSHVPCERARGDVVGSVTICAKSAVTAPEFDWTHATAPRKIAAGGLITRYTRPAVWLSTVVPLLAAAKARPCRAMLLAPRGRPAAIVDLLQAATAKIPGSPRGDR